MNQSEEYRKLWLQIQETKRRIERAKLKRNIITILCFCAAYFVLFYWIEDPEGWAILDILPVSLLLGVLNFLASAIVFSHLVHVGDSEKAHLASLEKELS